MKGNTLYKIMGKKKSTNIYGNDQQEMLCDNDISCFNKIAGTLTGEEIIKHKLVIPEKNSKQDSIQATTYDLTLGEGHYIYNGYNSNKDRKWNLVFIGTNERLRELNQINPEAEQYNRLDKDKPKTLLVPPFGSAFVQLNETVDLYTVAKEKKLLIVGRFDLKLSNVHQGLISQQATQVEPCYKGKLFCFIHNLSNKEILLKYGQKMATLEFSYVSCFCDSQKRIQIIDNLIKKNKSKYDNPFCVETGIKEVRYFHAEEQLPDDCGLLGFKEKMIEFVKTGEIANSLVDDIEKRIEKRAEKKAEKKSNWVIVIAAIISLIGTLFTAVYSTQKDVGQMQKLQETQENIIEDLQEQLKRLENDVYGNSDIDEIIGIR